MARNAPSVRHELKQSRPFRSPAEEATVALLRTADQMHRELADIVAPAGITEQQYNVLRILRGAAPESLQTLEIADRMIERTPGITRLLDRLEAKRLVRRERGRDDRRCVHCSITPEGLAALATLDDAMLRRLEMLFAGLGAAATARLTGSLDRLREVIRAREASQR